MKTFSGSTHLRGGVGRTRTNHQSVMECGGVRPAHLVGHQALGSKRAAIVGVWAPHVIECGRFGTAVPGQRWAVCDIGSAKALNWLVGEGEPHGFRDAEVKR